MRRLPPLATGPLSAAVMVLAARVRAGLRDRIPARSRTPYIPGSGGSDPTVALFTAQAGSDFADGQMIACTLAPDQAGICAASLKFFTTQAQIRTRITPARLATMTAVLASFVRNSLRLPRAAGSRQAR